MRNRLTILVDYDSNPDVEFPWQVESSREAPHEKNDLNHSHLSILRGRRKLKNVDEATERIGVLLRALEATSQPVTLTIENPVYPEIRSGQVCCSGECAHQDVCKYAAQLSGQPCPPAEEYLRSRPEKEN